MSKAIATEKMSKKMIVPVSKKLIAEVDLIEQHVYACYFKDGLLIVGEPLTGLNDGIFEQGRDRGYMEGHEDAHGYRDSMKCECGIDCEYDCRNCRFNPKKSKGGYRV